MVFSAQSNPVPSHTMKVLFVFALALAATQALDLETEWAAFKTKFEKGFLSATHVSCTFTHHFVKVPYTYHGSMYHGFLIVF